MGSYATLKVKNFSLDASKNYIDEFIFLFLESELQSYKYQLGEDDEVGYKFIAKVSDIKRRLNILGFGIKKVEILLNEYNKAEDNKYFISYLDAIKSEIPNNSNFENVIEQISNSKFEFKEIDVETLLSIMPSMFYLYSLAVEAFDNDEFVELDVTELIGNWLELDEIDVEVNLEYKTIIFTEGVYDTFVISNAMNLLYPGYNKYFTFLELDNSNIELNCSRNITYLKSLIAMGIKNRVIFIFDNDVEGQRSVKEIKKLKNIPDNFRFFTYPDLEFAKSYPTLCPNGLINLNINKRAASIEIFQCYESLLDEQNKSQPIQWIKFDESINDFHGVIKNKQLVQTNFKDMINAIQQVRKEISPKIFTEQLRPYFDPLTIDGKKYLAPGGAGMPLIIIDKLLWSSTTVDQTYDDYYQDNLNYLPYSYRVFAEEIEAIESIYPRFLNYINSNPITKELLEAGESLCGIFEVLLHFRAPHKRVADNNFKLRSKEAVGSGGFKPDLLQMLVDSVFSIRKQLNAFVEEHKQLKVEYVPYEIGTVFNPIEGTYSPELILQSVTLDYPSRLNAMAIDPSKIVNNDNMVFTPGEVVFAVNIPKRVKIEIIPGNEVLVNGDSKRKPLIKHSAIIVRKALGVDHGIKITVDNQHEMKHCGLGSSSGLISAVAAAINELYGNPIPNKILIKYLAQNHGEEIDNSDTHLMPVQCIGGSAAAGLSEGSVLILAGESLIICKAELDPMYKVIIGIPKDFELRDSKELMELKIQALPKFLETGQKHGPTIAYEMFHKVLPDLMKGRLKELGNLIFSYRFDMGSIVNCSFVYPSMVDIAQNIRHLKEQGIADVLSLSSVGPAFFAITLNPKECKRVFEENNLAIFETSLCNNGYSVMDKKYI
jgi:predicted sugar kinase